MAEPRTTVEPAAHDRLAAAWMLAALAAVSVEPIVAKLGYRGAAAPAQLWLVKTLVGALAIVPLTRVRRWIGWPELRAVARVAVLLLATSGLTLFALARLDASTVLTLVTTTPATVALANHLRGREVLTWRYWAGFALAFPGVLLTVGVQGGGARGADALGLAAALAAVASSTTYRLAMVPLTARLGAPVVSTYVFLVNGAVASVLALAVLAPLGALPGPRALPYGAWLGVAAAVANVAFLQALQRLGATLVSLVDLLERPLVIVVAALVLRERLSASQWAGVALVLLGVPLVKVRRVARPARA